MRSLIAALFGRRHGSLDGPAPAETALRDRVSRMLKNRLSDRIADIFRQAIMTGDLDTAEDLLVIMQNMHGRRQTAAGERRVDDEAIVRARQELDTRKALRSTTSHKPPPVA